MTAGWGRGWRLGLEGGEVGVGEWLGLEGCEVGVGQGMGLEGGGVGAEDGGMGSDHVVRGARRDEAGLLGEVLADAFAEDPVFNWLIPPQARGLEQRRRTFFTSMSRSYLRRGKPCYLSGGDLAGDAGAAALWAPPGGWAMPLSQVILEAVPNGLALRRHLLRGLRTQLQIERLHAAHSVPHWYLGYLGARRDQQGQGLGTQMLREVLDRADADGVPAYLESSNERNLTLYQRNGFRVVGELPALGHGPTIWRMWREPQPAPPVPG
ncbi:MAG TPA: GNAT family N-acetyltransferase [Streptosporangiaceae bacterium]|jgi:GNAT superfamily N-acetyltransferase